MIDRKTLPPGWATFASSKMPTARELELLYEQGSLPASPIHWPGLRTQRILRKRKMDTRCTTCEILATRPPLPFAAILRPRARHRGYERKGQRPEQGCILGSVRLIYRRAVGAVCQPNMNSNCEVVIAKMCGVATGPAHSVSAFRDGHHRHTPQNTRSGPIAGRRVPLFYVNEQTAADEPRSPCSITNRQRELSYLYSS